MDQFGERPVGVISRSWFWSLADSLFISVLQLISAIILARMLSPFAYGLMAVVLFFYNFIIKFYLCLSIAVIQKEDLSESHVNGVFTVGVICGFFSFLVMLLVGLVLWPVYENVVYFQLSFAMGLVALLASFNAVRLALLKRNMQFREIAIINAFCYFLAFCVAAFCANLGFGVWSLVAQFATVAVLMSLSLRFFLGWIPKFNLNFTEYLSLLKYGLKVVVGTFAPYISQNAQAVLLSYHASAIESGLYNRGQMIFQRPFQQLIGPVGAVFFPALSRAQNSEYFEPLLLRGNLMAVLLIFPFIATGVGFGDWVVAALLGEGWEGVGDVVRWLSLAGVPVMLLGVVDGANRAKGRPARGAAIHIAGLPVILCLLYVSADRGAEVIAKVTALFSIVSYIPLHIQLVRGLGVSGKRIFRDVFRRMIFLLVAIYIAHIIRKYCVSFETEMRIVCVGFFAVFSSVFVLLSSLVDSFDRSVIRDYISSLLCRRKLG